MTTMTYADMANAILENTETIDALEIQYAAPDASDETKAQCKQEIKRAIWDIKLLCEQRELMRAGKISKFYEYERER